jgi:hypothetical protein
VPAAAFCAYSHFLGCCAAADCLASRQTVLLQPVAFTLRHDMRAEPRAGALSFFAAVIRKLCQQNDCASSGGGGVTAARVHVRARLEGFTAALTKGVAPVAALLANVEGSGRSGAAAEAGHAEAGRSGKSAAGSGGTKQECARAAEPVFAAEALAACCSAAASTLPPKVDAAKALEVAATAGAVATEALAVCKSLLAAGAAASGGTAGKSGGERSGGLPMAMAAQVLPALGNCVPLLMAAAGATGAGGASRAAVELAQWLVVWERAWAAFGAPAMTWAAAQLHDSGKLESPELGAVVRAACTAVQVGREWGLPPLLAYQHRAGHARLPAALPPCGWWTDHALRPWRACHHGAVDPGRRPSGSHFLVLEHPVNAGARPALTPQNLAGAGAGAAAAAQAAAPRAALLVQAAMPDVVLALKVQIAAHLAAPPNSGSAMAWSSAGACLARALLEAPPQPPGGGDGEGGEGEAGVAPLVWGRMLQRCVQVGAPTCRELAQMVQALARWGPAAGGMDAPGSAATDEVALARRQAWVLLAGQLAQEAPAAVRAADAAASGQAAAAAEASSGTRAGVAAACADALAPPLQWLRGAAAPTVAATGGAAGIMQGWDPHLWDGVGVAWAMALQRAVGAVTDSPVRRGRRLQDLGPLLKLAETARAAWCGDGQREELEPGPGARRLGLQGPVSLWFAVTWL